MADTLSSNEVLVKGQELKSPNGSCSLNLQADGNLVLYHNTNPVWSANTQNVSVDKLVMQKDGNLILFGYAPEPAVRWQSKTGSQKPGSARLVVQDDGNLVIYYDELERAIWATGTNGK